MSENLENLEPAQTVAVEQQQSEVPPVAANPAAEPTAAPRLDAFLSIPVTLELVLKSLKVPVSKLMELQKNSEIDLDHPAGAEVALVVNGSKIAFGHLFLIDQNSRRVGVRISRLAAASGEV